MPIRRIKKIGYNIARAIPPKIRVPIQRFVSNVADWSSEITGRWRGNAVPAYWFRGCINFGDLFTPALLKYYGFSPYFSDKPLKGRGGVNDLAVVGSILTWLHPEFRGIILGCGAMSDKDPPKEYPHALFLAVRGELTKQLFRCADSVVLGDPGLLADRLFPSAIPKKYRLGIVIHQAEFANKLFEGKFELGADTKIIDPRRYPGDVTRDIAECEHIASSSLHGLVVADSLGIPCVRILLSEGLILGGDFKFDDYYTSIGIQHENFFVAEKVASDYLVRLTNTPPKEIVLQRKNDLHELFANLKTIMEEHARESR
jgi:pyruvyltransferase